MAKKKSERGIKTAAGLILSKFLRQIANEVTEFEKNADGQEELMSKAESLARKMWKIALGYKETVVQAGGVRKEVYFPPDRGLMALLYDRLEGRAPLMFSDTSKKNISDKVDEQAKNRIKKAGELDDSGE